MKKNNDKGKPISLNYLQIIRTVKLLSAFLVGFVLQLSANTYSQTTTLSLNLKNASIEKIFETIEAQSEFTFFYKNSELDVKEKVSVEANNKLVTDVLDQILSGKGLAYVITDKHVVIYRPGNTSASGKNAEIKQADNRIRVTGVVSDASGEPLPGATVLVKGSATATITGTDGSFSIAVPGENTVLQFSFLGYVTQEIKVGSQRKVSVTLRESEVDLGEVVVMGYYTQNRRDVSAATSKIDMKAIQDNPSASLTTMLAGQAPGLQTVVRSGVPGASGNGLVIRGNTSLSAANDVSGISNPLYIIDGVPMSLQDYAGFDVSQNDFLATLNTNEIKSIDILKDAAATAIYGARGANGVIIITTKRGITGKARFSASATMGVNMEPPKLDVYVGEAERQSKLNLFKQTLTNLFGDQAWVDVRNGLEVEGYMLPSVLTDKYNPAFNNAYDFQDMFYQSGLVQNYDLSMDGGSEGNSYRIGLGYYDEEGVLVGYGFSRMSVNASLTNQINKHINNDFSLRYTYLERQGGLETYMRAMPTDPTQLPSSLYYRTPEELKRMSGELGDAYNKNNTHSIAFSDALRIKLMENLSFDNQVSASMNFGSKDYFIPATARKDNKSYGESRSSSDIEVIANSVLNYYLDVKDSRFTALVGGEIITNDQKSSWMTGEDGVSDYLKVIQGYKKENINGETNIVKNNLLSYFGMVSYGYKENKYYVEGILRRDGSSRFGANNKWATFPSVKTSWAFSKESWMKDCSSWLDFGKLRVSFGYSGNLAGDALLQYNSLIATNNIGARMSDIERNKMDVKTYGGRLLLVSDFDKVANKGLTWDKAKEINYGIDLELFNRRLYVTGDIYSKYMSDLVYPSSLPPYLGYNQINSNLVDMVGKGFELGLTAYLFPRTGDFQWEWILNLAKSEFKVAGLGNGGRDYISYDGASGEYYAFVVGRPAFQFYTYEYLGTLDSFDDLPVNPMTGEALKYTGADAGLALNQQGKIFPGMPVFTDVNGDFLIDGGTSGPDKKIIDDKSPNPDIAGGLHTNIRYKGLSLRVQTSFAFGHYIFNTTLQDQLSKFDNVDQFFNSALYKFDDSRFWKEPGDGSYYPMIYVAYSDGGSARSFRRSSMFLEKADYWSIDNITLSYNLPKKILTSMHLRNLNVYATARNVYMWKQSGVSDPRLMTKMGYYNGTGYPLSPTVIFGLQLQF